MTMPALANAYDEPTGAPAIPVGGNGSTLCVIVPTRNESGNVVPLIERAEQALHGYDAQLLFVDDSTDDTPTVIQQAAETARIPVRLLHREVGDRTGGLGGAVLAGIRASHSEWVAVMDGDLQHPPEMLSSLLDAGQRGGYDVVIGSRYCGAGNAAGLSSRTRSLVSSASNAAASALFPRRLAGVSDPMSGLFAVRRAAIDTSQMRPLGFKILLELLARHDGLRVTEVPFTFAARHAGNSKASWREGVRYLRQLANLRMATSGATGRFIRFGLVGASGLLVNLVALHALIGLRLGTSQHVVDATAAVLATQIAIAWNFVLTEQWAFDGRARRQTWPVRAALYWALCSAALAAQLPIATLVQSWTGWSYVGATAVTVLALVVVRYLLVDRLMYRRAARRALALSSVPNGLATARAEAR
jgi:dolichol-phosphate mannosyltransferase